MSSACSAPLALLLLLLSSTALAAETITHLPGFDGPLPFHLETGYVAVEEDVELFYYFIHSERSPGEDPLFLWLNGGPGCSGLSGLLFDTGPLNLVVANYNGSVPTLVYNPYSWTKVASIIFLDYPAGTGFSFSRSPEAYVAGDVTSSVEVYKFMIKWFQDHPEFLRNPLYVTGDSYGGKIVPLVVHKLSEGNDVHHFYNLKGYVIGNPLTGELIDTNSRVPYAHGVGIIPDELLKEIEGHCEGEDYTKPTPNRVRCYNALDKFNQLYSEIYANYILEPLCAFSSPKPVDMIVTRSSSRKKYAEFLPPSPVPDVKCRSYGYYLSYFWANNNSTREVLHIKKDIIKEWIRCNFDMPYMYDVPSTVKYHLNLTSSGYRALVYSGDQDLYVPHVGTQAWIRSLNFSIVEDWRSWRVDGQVAGYTRKYINDLTFVTVKNAGHTAAEYQPRNCLVMLQRWILGQSL